MQVLLQLLLKTPGSNTVPGQKMLGFSLATEIQESDKKASGEMLISFFSLRTSFKVQFLFCFVRKTLKYVPPPPRLSVAALLLK